ncbi:MAG: hypothetical protein M3488_02920 [Actinomycetota bacterium]|nr:hypothetical protein [Actinomycetota bacterium]
MPDLDLDLDWTTHHCGYLPVTPLNDGERELVADPRSLSALSLAECADRMVGRRSGLPAEVTASMRSNVDTTPRVCGFDAHALRRSVLLGEPFWTSPPGSTPFLTRLRTA